MKPGENRKLTAESEAVIEQIKASDHPQDVKDDLIMLQYMLDAMPADAKPTLIRLKTHISDWE